MPTASTKAPAESNQSTVVSPKWLRQLSQRPSSASKSAGYAPITALVRDGIKSRAKEVGATALAAELDELAEVIDVIRVRMVQDKKQDGSLFSATMLRKAQASMEKLIDEGRLVDPRVFIENLSFSRQGLSKALKANRVFYVDVSGGRFYPDFFFDSRYQRKQLELVSKMLGDLPGASKLKFFTTKKLSLSGKTPLEALAEGQLTRVQTAARGFVQR
jgi:hypothetical protein